MDVLRMTQALDEVIKLMKQLGRKVAMIIMAITKIMCMKSSEHGNVAAHLKHSIAYICNETKTEKGSLVGGINCLSDFAYEQMIGTKEMFGQTGGR